MNSNDSVEFARVSLVLTVFRGFLDTISICKCAKVSKDLKTATSSPLAFGNTLDLSKCRKIKESTLRYLIESKRIRTNGPKRIKLVNMSHYQISAIDAEQFFSNFSEEFQVVIVDGSCALGTNNVDTRLYVDTYADTTGGMIKWFCFVKNIKKEISAEELDFALEPLENHVCFSEARMWILRVFEHFQYKQTTVNALKKTLSDGKSTVAWGKWFSVCLTIDGFSKRRKTCLIQ